ncbi:MAG: hypothetical protein Q8P84_07320 [Deltaproteobacteria bacterium]|nr:hypothetical protein [Deltaproteobacteria bacterium]
MKKQIVTILAGVVALGALYGCTGMKKSETTGTDTGTPAPVEEQAAPAPEAAPQGE